MEDAEGRLRDAARPATILDVAAAAGVSKSTVSRILDERLPRSRSTTADRVREAAARLGYQRDVSASNLRRGTTATIGVVVPRLTDTAMAMFYEAVARACALVDRFSVVATTDDRPGADRVAAEQLLSRRVDGLVLTTARAGDEFPAELQRRGVPHVLALRSEGSSPAAVGDDELGGYLATRHLLDLGHRRVGLIAGPSYASSARGRQAGYRRALVEAGLAPDSGLIRESAFTVEAGVDACLALMAHVVDPPTAIFAVNDNTAIGALSALAGLGRSVPHDVSVVGYNDIPIAARLPVPLTTVRVPFDDIAATAVGQLLRWDHGATTEPRPIAPTLIPRSSTARPAAPRSRLPRPV